MRVQLWDELTVPDVEYVPRLYCPECRRDTRYLYDAFDIPECLEHTQDEVES
ncbi:hypothetical protein ACFSHT_22250 [Paraburkholderia silviterrae]|uniref:hypothetical protein n=1 Tax=Paraburkholderia silviterrae TaxID=2528715 RepID=UPI001405032E|nr:hypothetical protein [Paraburkholderia silviterrae]